MGGGGSKDVSAEFEDALRLLAVDTDDSRAAFMDRFFVSVCLDNNPFADGPMTDSLGWAGR